jgi:hypothetical protein
VADVRSVAREGVREGAWDADRTIEMKVVCEEALADALAAARARAVRAALQRDAVFRRGAGGAARALLNGSGDRRGHEKGPEGPFRRVDGRTAGDQ